MDSLRAAFESLDTDAERQRFLLSLLSPGELKKLEKRWDAMRFLLAGCTQREAREQAKVSIATVSRAARQVDSSHEFLAEIDKRVNKILTNLNHK